MTLHVGSASSGLTWHGFARSHKVKIWTVRVCLRVCVEGMCAVVYICGKEEDYRMAILLF